MGIPKNKFFILILFLTLWSSSFCQSLSLSFDSELDFVNSLSGYADKAEMIAPKKELAQVSAFLNLYTERWNILDVELKEEIIAISKSAVDQNLAFYPDIYNFLQAQVYIDSVLEEQELSWLYSLHNILKKRKSKDFLKINLSINKLSKDRCLYSSLQSNWFVENGAMRWDTERNCFYFSDVDLKCRAYKDSSVIYKTNGFFDPLDQCFYGQEGRVYWERVGLSREEIYTNLNSYKLNLKSNKYESDSAILVYTFLNDKLLGNFVDKLSVKEGVDGIYPQFRSYNSSIHLSDVFQGIDIRGQYNQRGKKMIFGSKNNKAEVIVKKGDTIQGKIYSEQIVLKDKHLISSNSSWFIFIGKKDSIYHNTSDIRYDDTKGEFSIAHTTLFSVLMPAIDTYHKMTMEFENILWKHRDSKAEIGLLRIPDREGKLVFRSFDSFRGDDYNIIMNGIDYNPLYKIKKLAEKLQSNSFYVYDYAVEMGMSEEVVLPSLLQMASMGFLDYNMSNKKVVLLPKLYLYLAVSARKSDFDELEIIASGGKWIKANLSIDSLYMDVYDVEEVLLSAKQNVYLRPINNKIRILKDRNIDFNGVLHAGLFDFYVKDALFSYRDFKIEIGNVDTLLFSIKKDIGKDGIAREQNISTVIKSLSGVLYIDSNINKSGRKDFPQYPIFQSLTPSFVTYNDKIIQAGAYSADSFYFRIDPFKIEKLNTFSPDSVSFKGTFISGGIFPDIKESLSIMPDLSLGFIISSPAQGWSLYGDKAKFYDTLRLDNMGLVGKGRLEYLSSEAYSPYMLFLPAEARGKVKGFELSEMVFEHNSYPNIRADSLWVRFAADSATYTIKSLAPSVIYPYNEPWTFNGEYVFSDKISKADGEMSYDKSIYVVSKDWRWGNLDLSADSANMKIGIKKGKEQLSAKNLKLQADMLRMYMLVEPSSIGFVKNGDTATTIVSKVDLPLQAYTTTASKMLWRWQENTMDIYNIRENRILDTLEPLQFVSQNHNQKGLEFYATHSVLNYADTLLKVNGVREIKVADAIWMPDSMAITVLPNGRLKHIENAQLMFSENCPYFSFYKVKGNIHSADKYEASGWYSYNTPTIEPQPIYFSKINVTPDGYSIAKTYVGENSKTEEENRNKIFKLDQGFDFSGRLEISAIDACFRKNSDLYFDGAATMSFLPDGLAQEREQEREMYDKTDEQYYEEKEGIESKSTGSFKFKAYIDPASVMIPISSQTKSPDGKFKRAGFFMNPNNKYPYFTFMQTVRTNEQVMLSAEGFLYYNIEDKSYCVLDSSDNTILSMSLTDRRAYATDFIDLKLRFDNINPSFYGSISKSGEEGKIFIQSVCLLDFLFPQSLFKSMADGINKNNSLEGSDLAERDLFFGFINKKLKTKEAAGVIKDIKSYGTITQIPDILKNGIVFSNINFEWDEYTSSYRSVGKAELLSLSGVTINKKMKVMMQISRGRRGDAIDIYLESSKYSWYYFSYSDNIMQAISSDPVFNEELSTMKASKRKKGNYEFVISTMRKKNIFVTSFESSGGEDIYEEDDYEEDDSEEEY